MGKLYIVATPIGNVGDISKRAIETLKSADIIACEDSRVTGKLLKLLGIEGKKMVSLHQHSSEKVISGLIDELMSGQNIAYVTDGGTPGISDPGQALIAQIRNPNIEIRNKSQVRNTKYKSDETMKQCNNITIIPIPGASAVTSVISVSGMVEKEFYFAGFLPKKHGRQTKLKELSNLSVPVVIYEAAVRLARTLNDIQEHFGKETEVFIAREMTKMFEEYWGGNIVNIISGLKDHKLKGEITIIVKKLF
jgi:16S rRNA (cytidine1402-2'-O)-methyltransferase